MGLRHSLQRHVLDPFQFWLDRAGGAQYQPLPWVGVRSADRRAGCEARWDALQSYLEEETTPPIRSALDIGSSFGFFSFHLSRRGIPVLGVERDARSLRIANYVASRLEGDRPAFARLDLDAKSVALLPEVDLVLALAVWHHWVREWGLDAAGEVLGSVWAKTRRCLVFETGEAELSEAYGLSQLRQDPDAWLESYLAEICTGAEIRHLGRFPAASKFVRRGGRQPTRALLAAIRLPAGSP